MMNEFPECEDVTVENGSQLKRFYHLPPCLQLTTITSEELKSCEYLT